jgi:2-polyprenyl-3-methyl-5-hydroxy-6-metoxy-1,4-benzoquinol methylase
MVNNSQQIYWNKRYSDEGMIWGGDACFAAKRALSLFRMNNVKSILVPGCGYGRQSLYLALAGFSVAGFDISDEAVKIAVDLAQKHNVSYVSLKVADILDVECKERFDAILSINMLLCFIYLMRKTETKSSRNSHKC